ncbi:MAG: hypothetical protein WA603_03595 [Candidatus Acidiferrales bacterium]
MMIIGVDYHPSFQQISFLDQETGECVDRELNHSEGEAERFYRELKQRGANVRVGMEATGHARWFERLLAELGIEVWIGDAAYPSIAPICIRESEKFPAICLWTVIRGTRFSRHRRRW